MRVRRSVQKKREKERDEQDGWSLEPTHSGPPRFLPPTPLPVTPWSQLTYILFAMVSNQLPQFKIPSDHRHLERGASSGGIQQKSRTGKGRKGREHPSPQLTAPLASPSSTALHLEWRLSTVVLHVLAGTPIQENTSTSFLREFGGTGQGR